MKTLIIIIAALAIGWFAAMEVLGIFWFWNVAKPVHAILAAIVVILGSFGLTLVDPYHRWWAVAIAMTLPVLFVGFWLFLYLPGKISFSDWAIASGGTFVVAGISSWLAQLSHRRWWRDHG